MANLDEAAGAGIHSDKLRTPACKKDEPPKKDEPSLYAAHEKIYPRKISGTFRRIKWWTVAVLLGLYYVAPFIRWNRGPDAPNQAILVDMAGRRGYFFGIEIWPQEVYYLTGLLILGAIGLFLVTSLLGRVWCGFTCPQTVWTDLYVAVERWFEGDRNARMKLDKAPMSLNKASRKLGKHGVWLAIAFATGGAWVLYFNDAPTVIPQIFTGDAGAGVYTFLFLFTGTTYLLAGWAREQVCIYMCPWPRFQAAMFDEDSMIVTYEGWRGEPRGALKRGQQRADPAEKRGDCVDCSMCVQVCPTGIDIRNGNQLACIGCGLCVDACNSVMDKVGLPRDLIRFDSVSNQVAREKGKPTKVRWVRPRTVIYSVILVAVSAVMLFALLNRSGMEVNVQHERSPLFVTMSDGDIRNAYTYKILNMVREAKTYSLRVTGIEGAEISAVGVQNSEDDATIPLPVRPDRIGTFRIFVTAPPEALDGAATDITFLLTAPDGTVDEYTTVFAGPAR